MVSGDEAKERATQLLSDYRGHLMSSGFSGA